MEAQVIRLRFVTDDSLVSRIIRGAQLGFWASHVEAVTPDGFYLGAHYAGDVQKRPADYDKGQWRQQLFVDLPVLVGCVGDSAAQSEFFYSYLVGCLGDGYDMAAIGRMADGVLTGSMRVGERPKWICSGLIEAALFKAGAIVSPADNLNLTTPRDVLMQCAALTALGTPETAA
jgi:hypothetical protein